MEKRETIVSQITAHGRSAVSVVRLSGADAFNMVKIFGMDFPLEHHRIYVTDLKYKGKILDKAVISVFHSPHSYTGEDVIEISVHGGSVSSKRIVTALIESGCRHAERGEFTKRGFLNGKISIIDAESVLMKVNALTEDVFDSASDSKSGPLMKHAESIRKKIMDLKSFVQASIDFPDDIDYSKTKSEEMINEIIKEIDSLHKKAKCGYISDNHPLLVITGRTNTGKSTLFNRLLKADRAIVTEEEGTTRDIIGEWANINGHPVKILDTAGIREAESIAEKIGIKKLPETLKKASLTLFLFDLEKGFTEEDRAYLEELHDINQIIVGNKSDKARSFDSEVKHMKISALSGEGLEELEEKIVDMLHFNEKVEITVNERQMHIIDRMKAYLSGEDAKKCIDESELLDEKINEVISDIKELTGEILSEDILDNIFNNFCIGK